MGKILATYMRRATIDGHFRTCLYVFGAHLLPLLRVQIKYQFAREVASGSSRPVTPPGYQVGVACSVSDFCQRDFATLEEYEGGQLVDFFHAQLDRGMRCVFSRDESGKLVSACWLAPASERLCIEDVPTYVVRDCFTLPAARGRGFYPKVLDHAAQAVFREHQSARVCRLLVNSYFSNRSSIRGILKAGFARVGVVVQVGSIGWISARYGKHRVLCRVR